MITSIVPLLKFCYSYLKFQLIVIFIHEFLILDPDSNLSYWKISIISINLMQYLKVLDLVLFPL